MNTFPAMLKNLSTDTEKDGTLEHLLPAFFGGGSEFLSIWATTVDVGDNLSRSKSKDLAFSVLSKHHQSLKQKLCIAISIKSKC